MSASNSDLRQARIESVEHAGAFRTLAPNFYNRPVLEPRDLRQSSPFVVLVEDYVGALDDDHLHPHRGFETVTFVLAGEITNVDHTGYSSVTPAGAVQWMTAGSGIMHGGRPHNGATCHMLQLWLNLPSALRGSAPGSREQSREQALRHVAPGVTAMTYGERSLRPGQPSWSLHPMTLIDVQLEPAGRYDLEVAPGERMFVYVLSGEVEVTGQPTLTAGDVAWIAVDPLAGVLSLDARKRTRLIAYTSVPIDEPSIARGPFVMTDNAGIRQAFADLEAGRLLS